MKPGPKKGRLATVGARQALVGHREQRRRLAEEIVRYARDAAGTPADLDESLEAVAIESLRTAGFDRTSPRE